MITQVVLLDLEDLIYNIFLKKYQNKSFDSDNSVIWTDLLVCYMDRDCVR